MAPKKRFAKTLWMDSRAQSSDVFPQLFASWQKPGKKRVNGIGQIRMDAHAQSSGVFPQLFSLLQKNLGKREMVIP